MFIINAILLFFSRMVYGRGTGEINYEVDAMVADGVLVCTKRRESSSRLRMDEDVKFERHTFHFTVENKRLLRLAPKQLAARMISEAIMNGYSPHYIQLEGVYYTHLGKMDPDMVAREEETAFQRWDDHGPVAKRIFNFSKDTPHAA